MTRTTLSLILVSMVAIGCQSTPPVGSFTSAGVVAQAEAPTTQLAQYSEDATDSEPDLPEPTEQAEPIPSIAVSAPEDGLTMEALEQMALGNNPAVGQASAR